MYLNTDTGEFPRYAGDIMLESPDWTIGEPLPHPWVDLEVLPEPVIEEGQMLTLGIPHQSETGQWQVGWAVRNLSVEELHQMSVDQVKSKLFLGLPITTEEALLLVHKQ